MENPLVNIYMLGMNHFDPYGPYKAKEAILELLQRGITFDCIYIEWDELIAKTLIKEREAFKDYLTNNTQIELNSTTIKFTVDTLAYEADVHTSIIPTAKTIWMDEGSKLDSIEGYFKFRLDILLQSITFACVDPNNLQNLSAYLWQISMNKDAIGFRDLGRDRNLYNRIIESDPNQYHSILVLIGAAHALGDLYGSTAQLLIEDGYVVKSLILSPTPRPVDPTTTSPDV